MESFHCNFVPILSAYFTEYFCLQIDFLERALSVEKYVSY
jgi:hypothetical protein